MEALLRNDFTAHYDLAPCTEVNLSVQTDERYFEIEDVGNETLLYFEPGEGTAIYRNDHGYQVEIINHDKFLSSLSSQFQQNRERCDLIVYTLNVHQYFLLNELSDTDPAYIDFVNHLGARKGKRIKATSQLLSSLSRIMMVPAIAAFINNYAIRRCCFFNKRAIAPETITATASFNLINTIAQDGLQMSNPDMEILGFQLFEYSGGRSFVLN